MDSIRFCHIALSLARPYSTALLGLLLLPAGGVATTVEAHGRAEHGRHGTQAAKRLFRGDIVVVAVWGATYCTSTRSRQGVLG